MDNYDKFQELLDKHPAGAPKSAAFSEILRLLFTDEEIHVALAMNFIEKSVEEIAEKASLSKEITYEILESMANKAVIYCNENNGNKTYALLPTILGIFEFPFMAGTDERSLELKHLGRLWEEYHQEAMGLAFCGSPTPFMRVLPVEKSLDCVTNVYPYDEVANIIEDADYIAATNCACRVGLGKCDKPIDVCLIFGQMGEFLVQRNHAKQVSMAEAINILDRAETAGLVHTSSNNTEKPVALCNCCPCCCTILRGRTQLNHPHAFAPSRYEAFVTPNTCSGCARCANERCPMQAIKISNGVAVVSTDQCIGCGLCVSSCPNAAISLTKRVKEPDCSPETVTDLAMRVLIEKDKLEGFLATMA